MNEEHRQAIIKGIKKSIANETSKSRKGIKRPPRSKEWSKKISEAKKGKPTWNKGKKLSKQHVKNLKVALIGRKLSQSHKDNIGLANLKEKNCNWIGGARDYNRNKLKTIYKECVLCKSKRMLEMHHKDKNNKNNKRPNIIIICKECHEFWHHN